MAQFDVHRNTSGRTSRRVPYIVVLQDDRLSSVLPTRVVAPLVRQTSFEPAVRLNPLIEIEGEIVLLSTAELASVKLTLLGPFVCNVAQRRDDIVAAIDMLFTGI